MSIIKSQFSFNQTRMELKLELGKEVGRLLRNAKSDKDRYNISNIYSIKHNMLHDVKRMS